MRIAWAGPTPDDQGGVANVAALILEGLARLGVEVDCFLKSEEERLPASLRQTAGLRFIRTPPNYCRGLLGVLNPAIGSYVGQVLPANLPHEHQTADLLIQPSHYEPFALPAREALACWGAGRGQG